MRIDDILHNLTLEYIEVEQICTKHLSTERKNLNDAVKLFQTENLLLSSIANQDLLVHLNKVAGISVGRALADRVKGAEFLKKHLKNHYDHPNSGIERKHATIFVKKPQYYHEMKNNEMIELLKNVQLEFLEMTAELVPDQEAFLSDLHLIPDVDSDRLERE